MAGLILTEGKSPAGSGSRCEPWGWGVNSRGLLVETYHRISGQLIGNCVLSPRDMEWELTFPKV